jgi:hypothetical protein
LAALIGLHCSNGADKRSGRGLERREATNQPVEDSTEESFVRHSIPKAFYS